MVKFWVNFSKKGTYKKNKQWRNKKNKQCNKQCKKACMKKNLHGYGAMQKYGYAKIYMDMKKKISWA